jgi:hypothetical protein
MFNTRVYFAVIDKEEEEGGRGKVVVHLHRHSVADLIPNFLSSLFVLIGTFPM